MSPDKVRKPHGRFIGDVVFRRDRKHFCEEDISGRQTAKQGTLTVQLFEGELLRLSDKTENHTPGDKVESSIETD